MSTLRHLPLLRVIAKLAMRPTALFFVAIVGFTQAMGAEEATSGGWSADLLHQILQVEPAKPATPAPAAGEMVLRTYRLTHLRVAEAGKAQNVLAILSKLLPPGSSINSDVPANSLHVLTTPAAHKAIWDYLSAVDVPETTAQPANTVPEDVKAALQKLANAGDQSTKLLAAVGALKSDVSAEIAQIDARQRQQTTKLVLVGAAIGLALLMTMGWTLRRRATPIPPTPSTELALAPEQLTTALAPVHDKMRTEVLGLLNEVAIKLQAQHNEQQKLVREQQRQLEDARLALAEERKQFISETGTMVVQAVERVDATTAKLAKQQDKVAELVEELQNTVRELDQTKDSLRTKQVELEQERAKIAALSILLEEGGSIPPPAFGAPRDGHAIDSASTPAPDGAQPVRAEAEPNAPTPLSCTIPAPAPGAKSTQATTPRFTFLPPDHPET